MFYTFCDFCLILKQFSSNDNITLIVVSDIQYHCNQMWYLVHIFCRKWIYSFKSCAGSLGNNIKTFYAPCSKKKNAFKINHLNCIYLLILQHTYILTYTHTTSSAMPNLCFMCRLCVSKRNQHNWKLGSFLCIHKHLNILFLWHLSSNC